MKPFSSLILFVAALLSTPSAVFAATPGGCDLGEVRTIGELQAKLSVRAVDAVRLAAMASGPADERFGASGFAFCHVFFRWRHVGLPMGIGVAGLRALVAHMRAASFRYYGWDGIPTPVENACAMHEVKVEFIDATARNAFPETFTFETGRIVAAAGWSRSLEVGQIFPGDDGAAGAGMGKPDSM
jgi:hypothetical protein